MSGTQRTLILANSTQRHNVSHRGFELTLWQDPALYADASTTSFVTIDFAVDRIRIQNNTGSTWASINGILLQLDLSDYLMAPQPGTISPSSIPFYVPTTGSSALNGYTSGLRAWDDFNRAIRSGSLDKTGATVAGTDDLGAVAV